MTLATPRFDAEATVTAQPVVPIARRAADHANAAMGRVVSLSNRRRSLLLGMFVVSALFVGVAGGFGLALYRDRQTADASSSANLSAPPETIASQSDVKDTPAAITQTTGARRDETQSQRTTTEAPVVPARDSRERAETNDTAKETSRDSSAATTTRRKKTDDTDNRTSPSDNRNSRTAKASAEENRSRVKDERESRREERREEKRSRQEERASRREVRAIDRVGDVLSNRPRRASQRNAPEPRRVDRIRDIFEGRQP